MTAGGSPGPQGWLGDPAVDAGFAAAYAPADGDVLTAAVEVPAQGVPSPPDASPSDTPASDPPASDPAASDPAASDPAASESALTQDERDLRADLAARRTTADGRRQRAPQPARLSPARALAGAAVSVAGVCLGIGTLLWVSDDPSEGPGPVVTQPVAGEDDAAAVTGDALADSALPDVAAAPDETELAPVDPPPLAVAAPPAPAVPSAAPSAVAAPSAPSLVVPVTVLNNSNRTGLADRAARRFVAGGWPVRLTGNFRGQIPVTTVYYDPGLEASARAFAAAFDGMVRVRPRFATLPARGVVVVLTREYAA